MGALWWQKLPPLVVPNRTSELIKQKGLGYYIVWTLSEPYLDNCWHFFPIIFFTSANLMRDLELRGTYTCSTVHTDRRDYPADLKHAKLVPGEIRTHQCRIWWLQCEGTNMLYLSNQQTLLWSPRSKLYSRLCEKEESELTPQTWRKSQMRSLCITKAWMGSMPTINTRATILKGQFPKRGASICLGSSSTCPSSMVIF